MKNPDNAKTRAKHVHKRIMLWSLLLIGLGAMIAPLGGYVFVELAGAQNGTFQDVNPRSEMLWRDVREGVSGVTTIVGDEAGVLIQNGGENWRQIRNGWVASLMPWVMLAALVGIASVYFLLGRNRLDERPAGKVVMRWKLWERVLHWTTATLFIVLSITGLSLLFGRAVLIPLLGPEGFAAYAQVAMMSHNYVGPFFAACIGVMALAWASHNIPNRSDWEWFKAGGGFIKGKHPSAGRMNGGEKVWFWFIILVGGAVCVSGVVMNFPIWGQTREMMQQANLVHAVAAILWIALFFGHAYIGTLGTEGAIDGMKTGYTTVEWAKQHHDLWYEEVKDQAIDVSEVGAEPDIGASNKPASS